VWRALALRMGLPLAVLQRVMTHREFVGWRAFFRREPFDDARCFDLPAAMLRQLYVNSHRKPGSRPHPLQDFLPSPTAMPTPRPTSTTS
jgi:hypothetical protein